MVSTVGACELIRWTQPPDAENRMSGGVGGLTGEIPLARPDQGLNFFITQPPNVTMVE